MKIPFVERIWKQVFLVIAVLLITTAIAMARDMGYPAVRFRELIIMDPKVFYHERILDKLPQNTRVVFLNGDTSGMDQITKILAREKDIQVLRIFSHGSPGQLFLNGEVIDSRTLAEYRRSLNTWADALTDDADIVLYGCNIADTEKGRGFVNELARLTGADVAASTNFTGGPENEWTLEYKTGTVEARELSIKGYPDYLDTYTVTSNGDSGVGTLRQAIVDATDGDEIVFNLPASSETIALLTQLTIAESLTINGDNTAGSGTDVTVQVTTPGDSPFRVFNINASGKTVNISNMTVNGGSVASNGGGIGIGSGTIVTLENAIISGSTATNGGGIFNDGTLNMDRCTVSGNTSNQNGGGITNGGTITSLTNSTISGNTATYGGGGIRNDGTITSLTNSTISGNTTSYFGGGICNNTTITSLTNSTISDNTAAYEGGGITNYGDLLAIQNTIIANNTSDGSPDDYYYKDGTLTDNGYNVVETQNTTTLGQGFQTTNNILNTNPTGLASSLSYEGGYTQVLKVTPGNLTDPGAAGSTTETTDQRGYYRTASAITRGAYQYNGVVAKIGTGTSWTADGNYTTIDSAYNAALTGNIIELAGTAILESGIALDESKAITIRRDDALSDTTYVQAAASAGTASNRVFNITAGTATLEDMTIRYGNIAGNGGGISNSATLTINNSTISGNTASEYGGGIYNDGSGNVNINSSYLSGNTAHGCGGIINYGDMDIVGSTISGNTAQYYGGGIYTSGEKNMTLENSTVSGNTCTGASGGGIYMTGGTSELTNSTISGNRSDNHGGGIYTSGGGGTLIVSNCTIANNHSDEDNSEGGEGGGIYFSNTTLTASNTILANNYKGSGTGTGDDYYYATGTLIDNGYNVVEYQNLASNLLNNHKAFFNTTDILFNTQHGNVNTDFTKWTQSVVELDNQTLGLSSTLALNGSTNGTKTLALGEDSFATAGPTAGIPYDTSGSPGGEIWNGSPAADQRGIARTADQNTGIGAYSANYLVTLYYYKSDADGGDWHVSSGDYTWTRSLTEDGPYENTYETPTTANSNSVTIVDGAIVTITSSDDVTMDHLTVNDGAGLVLNTGGSLEITDGSEEADFTVNGTLDMDGGSFTLTSGALAYGAASTLIYSDSAASQTTGGELKTTGMGNVTFNNPNGVSVSGATAVNGTLTISTGTLLTTSSNITASGQTSGTGTVNASAGTFTYNRSGDQTLFSRTYYNLTHSGGGTKTLTGNVAVNHDLTIDGGATLDVNCSDPLTVQNNLTVTNGTIDLSDFDGNLKLGGNLVIENNGRWSKQSNSTKYIQFYGSSCTFTDNSSGDPQNLGHVKVD